MTETMTELVTDLAGTQQGEEAAIAVTLRWCALGPATEEAGRALISSVERSRLGRMTHPRAWGPYLGGRWLVRTQLSEACAQRVAPGAWRFRANRHGCPSVDTPLDQRGLSFNLSHTDGAAIVALTGAGRPVGVDVEDVQRNSRTVEIAERFFAPSEVLALRALPATQQRARFFDYWTLKEAYIKARGMGLALPLKGFAFDVEGGEGSPTIAFAETIDDDPTRWWFWQGWLTPRHRVSLAVAAEGRPVEVDLKQIAPKN